MNGPFKTSFGFTKLVVEDGEAMAEYYHQVYGLNKQHRVQTDGSSPIGPIREVIMGRGTEMSAESLVMLKFLNQPAPRDRGVLLGFITEDLDALEKRVAANGGQSLGPIRSMPEHGVRVLFTTDPEGHLSENVEMIKA